MFYVYCHSRRGDVLAVGFGITEAEATAAGKAVCTFAQCQSAAKQSGAFFDEESGRCVFPEAKGIPPTMVGFTNRRRVETLLMERCRDNAGSAGVFHRDHRGE